VRTGVIAPFLTSAIDGSGQLHNLAAFPRWEKAPGNHLYRRLGGHQRPSGLLGEDNSAIELRPVGLPTRSLFVISTELAQLYEANGIRAIGAPNERFTYVGCIGKDLEENGGSLIEASSRGQLGETGKRQETSVRIAVAPANFRTRHLLNESLKRYCCANPLGFNFVLSGIDI
jgi:hypothetical protein